MLAASESEESYLILNRMVPPGSLTYFYSTGDTQQLAKDPHKELVTLTDQSNPTKGNQKIQIAFGEQNKVTVKVPKINYCDEDIEISVMTLKAEELAQIKGLPRAEPVVDAEEERPKTPWTFEKSIFSSYTVDNEEIMLNCFDFDWHSGKLEKVSMKYMKEQRDKVYDYLLSKYQAM